MKLRLLTGWASNPGAQRLLTLFLIIVIVIALPVIVNRDRRKAVLRTEPLTLELINDVTFLNGVKSEPEENKEKILVEAAKILLSEIHTVTDNKHRDFVPGDFEKVTPVIDFILAIDPWNGHAIYFKGEVYRLLNDDTHFPEYFQHYLKIADTAGLRLPTVTDPRLCYETPHGYCEQRTAWISQLLANYYYNKGNEEPDKDLKSESFNLAREYIRNARSHFPVGFPASSVTLSTADLENRLSINRIR